MNRSPLDYPPEVWQQVASGVGAGGAVTVSSLGNVTMSNTTGANYMTASSVSR